MCGALSPANSRKTEESLKSEYLAVIVDWVTDYDRHSVLGIEQIADSGLKNKQGG